MGFFDSISDMLEAALPWSTAEAEAPKEEDETKVGTVFLAYWACGRLSGDTLWRLSPDGADWVAGEGRLWEVAVMGGGICGVVMARSEGI